MDRVDRLREAYREAEVAGAELLKVLRNPSSAETLERISQLVDRREAAAAAATSLFQPGDQEGLQAELQGLVQQQRALEGEMGRYMASLQEASQAAAKARTTMGGTRRLIRPSQQGRWIDELR